MALKLVTLRHCGTIARSARTLQLGMLRHLMLQLGMLRRCFTTGGATLFWSDGKRRRLNLFFLLDSRRKRASFYA